MTGPSPRPTHPDAQEVERVMREHAVSRVTAEYVVAGVARAEAAKAARVAGREGGRG